MLSLVETMGGGEILCSYCNLSRTLVPSSPVLVELQLWRGGSEKRDTLPKVS